MGRGFLCAFSDASLGASRSAAWAVEMEAMGLFDIVPRVGAVA